MPDASRPLRQLYHVTARAFEPFFTTRSCAAAGAW